MEFQSLMIQAAYEAATGITGKTDYLGRQNIQQSCV